MIDWITCGFPCLNCGEHVPNSCKTEYKIIDNELYISGDSVVFEGICKSKKCKKLPPGGNPFFVVIE